MPPKKQPIFGQNGPRQLRSQGSAPKEQRRECKDLTTPQCCRVLFKGVCDKGSNFATRGKCRNTLDGPPSAYAIQNALESAMDHRVEEPICRGSQPTQHKNSGNSSRHSVAARDEEEDEDEEDDQYEDDQYEDDQGGDDDEKEQPNYSGIHRATGQHYQPMLPQQYQPQQYQPQQSYHPKPVPVPIIPSVRPLPVQPQQYQPQQPTAAQLEELLRLHQQAAKKNQPQPARQQPTASSSAACSTLPAGLAPSPPSEKESNVLSDAFIASLNFGLRMTQATASAVASAASSAASTAVSATRASYNYVSGDSPEQRAARQQNARNQANARKIHNSIAREESSHWAYRWTLGMGVHGAAWTLSCAKGAISRQWGVEKARWDLANANVDLEYAQRMNQRILEYITIVDLSPAIQANLMRILAERYNVHEAQARVTELQRIHTEAVAAATAAAKTAAKVAALTAEAAATDAADKKRIRQLQAAAESIGQVALRVRNDTSRERVRAYVEAQRPLMHLMTNSRAINAQRGSDAEQILLEAARAVDAEMEPAQENLCAQMNQLVSEARAIKLDDAKMSKSIEKLEQSLEASSNAIAGAAQAAQTVKLLRTVSGEISERVHAVLEENLQTVHSEDSLRREELRMLESIATTPMGDLHSEEQHRLISASITRRRQQLIAEYKDMLENIEMSAEDQQELQRLLQELQEANEEDRVRFQEAERRRNATARETPDEDDEKEPGTPDNTRKGGYSLEKGKLYDRKGRLLYSGELVNGVPHGKGTAYDVESGKGYKAKFKGGKML